MVVIKSLKIVKDKFSLEVSFENGRHNFIQDYSELVAVNS